MLEVICACGKKLKAPDEAAGRKAKCRSCGSILTLPHTQPVPTLPTPDTLDPTQALARSGVGSSSGSPKAAASGEFQSWPADRIEQPDSPTKVPANRVEPDEDDPAVAEPTISRPWYSDPILRLTLLIPIVAGLAMSVYLYRERLKAKFVAELKSIESSARQAVAMGRMREAFDQYEKVTVLARDASDEEALTLARKAEAEHARLKPLVQAQIEREAAELARKEQEARAALAIKAKIEAEAQSKQAAVKAFETEQEQLAKTTANLKGGAWVIKGAGQSDILRGLEIYVIRQQMLKKDLADPIRSVQTDSDFKDMGLYIKELPVQPDDTVVDLGRVYQAIRNVQRPYTDEYNMNAMRNEVSWPRFVLEAKVEQSTTNIDGKYELKGLKGGRYFLYARSISSFSAIEWLQPLEVSESGEVSADFYNSTAKLILNKND